MPTPTLVQSAFSSGTNVPSIAATFGSNVTAGNTIIAYTDITNVTATSNVTDTLNATGGLLYVQDVFSQASAHAMGVYRFTNSAAGADTVTLHSSTSTGVSLRLVIQEWANIDTLIPFDQSTNIAAGTSTTPTATATGTLLQAGDLVVGWAVGVSSTWTAGAGFTLDPNITQTGVARSVEYLIAPNTNAVTAAFTMSASGAWVILSAAYRPQTTRKVLALTNTALSTFSAPSDWPGMADRAELIGGGGAGRNANTSTQEGCGGGGGAYAVQNNYTLPNGTAIQIGQGGTTNAANGTGTWIVNNTTFIAVGGLGGAIAQGGNGGNASNCIPTTGANSGGNGGVFANSTTCGATGGGGAGGPYGPGANGGGQNATGTTGGTGGGGAGGGTAGTNETASNQAGTTGGLGGTANGTAAGTGGAGGASGTNPGTGGSNSSGVSGGGGGGGGGSSGSATGGSGGGGGPGAEWTVTSGIPTSWVGSGGGGGGTGQQATGGPPPSPGNGGLYGGGGGGGGSNAFTGFGTGANGIIVLTYTPVPPPTTALAPFSSTQFFVQDQVVVS